MFRWQGGKSRCAETLLDAMGPGRRRRWIEPFMGSAAMFQHAERRGMASQYLLSDLSPHLVEAARTLAAGHLLPALSQFAGQPEHLQRERYLAERTRASNPEGMGERVFLLQACCFNGLWRLNRAGAHNVPWGRRPAFDWEGLGDLALALRGASVRRLDFREALSVAGGGDLVYCDPPYLGTHDYSSGFAARDHVELAYHLAEASARGAECWVSGSDTQQTRSTYFGKAFTIRIPASVGGRGARRGPGTELLIRAI